MAIELQCLGQRSRSLLWTVESWQKTGCLNNGRQGRTEVQEICLSIIGLGCMPWYRIHAMGLSSLAVVESVSWSRGSRSASQKGSSCGTAYTEYT